MLGTPHFQMYTTQINIDRWAKKAASCSEVCRVWRESAWVTMVLGKKMVQQMCSLGRKMKPEAKCVQEAK